MQDEKTTAEYQIDNVLRALCLEEFLKLHNEEELLRLERRARNAGFPGLQRLLQDEIRDRYPE